jgi:hypothetical protein
MVGHAAELDDRAVAGALHDASVMRVDGRIDQIATQPPEPRQGAILVRSREPAVADDIRDQDRRNQTKMNKINCLRRQLGLSVPLRLKGLFERLPTQRSRHSASVSV